MRAAALLDRAALAAKGRRAAASAYFRFRSAPASFHRAAPCSLHTAPLFLPIQCTSSKYPEVSMLRFVFRCDRKGKAEVGRETEKEEKERESGPRAHTDSPSSAVTTSSSRRTRARFSDQGEVYDTKEHNRPVATQRLEAREQRRRRERER